MARDSTQLKRFLRANLYQHPQVTATTEQAKDVVRDLFSAYLADASEGPGQQASGRSRLRGLADYIAGMTDRFALREHERLTGRRLFD